MVRDINDIMPKIKNMRWGALMNNPPTSQRIQDMNSIFPHNGRWHTVFDVDNSVIVDGVDIRRNDPDRWT